MNFASDSSYVAGAWPLLWIAMAVLFGFAAWWFWIRKK